MIHNMFHCLFDCKLEQACKLGALQYCFQHFSMRYSNSIQPSLWTDDRPRLCLTLTTDMRVRYCRAESHKENSQPDVQGVGDDVAQQSSLLHQGRRTLTSPVSHSNEHKDHEAATAPVKRPSIFGSVALLAESSNSTPARSVRHRLTSSASPTAAATSYVEAFVTPPYTPRSRSLTHTATPLAVPPIVQQPQQPLPSRSDHLSASLMTSPSVVTPDNRHQRQRGLQMTYTPPFTPVRPATTTPVGRPRSRLSLHCPSPLQDLTRPPTASLPPVCGINL